MAKWLRALDALLEDPGLSSRTHTKLITFCTSISKRSDSYFLLLWVAGKDSHVGEKYTYT